MKLGCLLLDTRDGLVPLAQHMEMLISYKMLYYFEDHLSHDWLRNLAGHQAKWIFT